MAIQYSVEFHAVRFTKYKDGAPHHLLKIGGRWQKAGLYGGFENMGYTPNILTDNKSLYEAAPDMYKVIEQIVKWQDSDGGELNEYMFNSKLSFKKLLSKARGE